MSQARKRKVVTEVKPTEVYIIHENWSLIENADQAMSTKLV